jgi:hypothetical protein
MPVSQLPQAPYRQDRKIFPTPIIGDVLFSEVRDCNRGNPFPEYGTPYPNSNKWPDHKLVYIKPVDIERNEIFEFFYAAERENQDLYNFAFGNRVIGNREFRTVTRTYVTLRENFKPVDIEFGTAMPNVPEDKFEGVNYVFYDKEQQNTQQEELNALFVIEAHSYVEEAVLDEVLTLSTERQDPLPPKFRVLSPTTTTDELAEGSVETPVLTGDQLAATEDQINTNLKRKRTVSRSSAENTSSLSGKQVTNDLQVADVVETIVPDGTTITTSALTVDGSVESLGNGQSVQRVITAPELFTAKSFSAQRPDPVPEKFRVLVPTESTEENEAGTAEMPILSAGEFEETEQQVNVHVKRKRKTKRNIATLPKTLTQKSTTNEKQVATVKETLQNGDTAVQPSALVDVQSEALGDGTYVVREVTIPKIFLDESISVQKPDTVPEKFRTKISTITKQINKEGKVTTPVLTEDQINNSQQQINEFVYQEQITTRGAVETPVLNGAQSYVGGTVAKTEETYIKSSTPPLADAGYLIQESRVTPISEDEYIKETVSVSSWPTLYSAEWDDNINGLSVKEQQVLTSAQSNDLLQTKVSSKSVQEYEAINEDRTVRTTTYAPKEIDTYIKVSSARINVTIPPILKKITVQWDEDRADGFFMETGKSETLSVEDGSVSSNSNGNVSGSASATPVLDIDVEQIWANDLVALNYYYFVDSPNRVLGRLNILIGGDVKEWPIFKPKTFTVYAIGKSVAATARWARSQSKSKSVDREAEAESSGAGQTGSIETNFDVTKIGPCLCAGISISNSFRDVTAQVTGSYVATSKTRAQVSPTSLTRTSPIDVPRSGLYLIDSRVEPYKWGYYKVIATVLDATQLS